MMIQYKEFRPSAHDSAGLGLPDRQKWLVLPCGRNRDSGCLDESNFAVALEHLGGESDDVEVHRFGHWACGWFEVILVNPDSMARITANVLEERLEDYPVLDEDDLSEREQTAANETWQCYSAKERLEYVRTYRSQFEFRSFRDLLGCIRGKFFAGYASELLAR